MPPQPPPANRALERAQAKHREYVAEREQLQRISLVRGLIFLAMIILLASVARAGFEQAFPMNWWRF